jgi:hypothetical protein
MAKTKSKAPSPPKVYEFTVTLKETSPRVWRKFLAHENIYLEELHTLIQIVMGWDETHLYEFSFGKRKFTPFDESEKSTIDDVSLKDALGDLKKFTYVYDFGDYWKHEVKITKTLEHDPRRIYPVCIGGENAAPPEDCGGPRGFENFKEVMAGESTPKRDEFFSWCGGFFDPTTFDPNFVNRFLLWPD